MSLIERNDFTPSILTAIKIARIFGEPVEDIFIMEEEDFENKKVCTSMFIRGLVGGIIGYIIGAINWEKLLIMHSSLTLKLCFIQPS